MRNEHDAGWVGIFILLSFVIVCGWAYVIKTKTRIEAEKECAAKGGLYIEGHCMKEIK